MMACAHLCLAKQSCFSFNFDISPENFGFCELNSEVPVLNSNDIGLAEGWAYGRLDKRQRNDTNPISKPPGELTGCKVIGKNGKNIIRKASLVQFQNYVTCY